MDFFIPGASNEVHIGEVVAAANPPIDWGEKHERGGERGGGRVRGEEGRDGERGRGGGVG